jgi:hypothetical protein
MKKTRQPSIPSLDMLSKPKRRIIAEMASWVDQSPDRFFLNIVRDEQKKRAREVAACRRFRARLKKIKIKPLTPEEMARWKALEAVRKLVRGY